MDGILKDLEVLLNITFSKTFREFWKTYVPEKMPSCFDIQRRSLGGEFGARLPHPAKPGCWLIVIDENLDHENREVTLAHEIVHLSLDKEGYPMIASRDEPAQDAVWGEVAANLHSVLVHQIVWFRMREYGFPVDDHIRVKSTGQLEDLQSKIHNYPKRKMFPYWQNWLLLYVLARLEWGESEREQIYKMFANRHVPIGRQGEKYVKKLASLGYFEPSKLTPQIVANAGQMLLQRLNLNNYFILASTIQLY